MIMGKVSYLTIFNVVVLISIVVYGLSLHGCLPNEAITNATCSGAKWKIQNISDLFARSYELMKVSIGVSIVLLFTTLGILGEVFKNCATCDDMDCKAAYAISVMAFCVGLLGVTIWNARVPDAEFIHIAFANLLYISVLLQVYILSVGRRMWALLLLLVGVLFAAFAVMSDAHVHVANATQFFDTVEHIHAIFQYAYFLLYYYILYRIHKSCQQQKSCMISIGPNFMVPVSTRYNRDQTC